MNKGIPRRRPWRTRIAAAMDARSASKGTSRDVMIPQWNQ
nr:MAG TPA: hypothetical protein [Caudoviricetes sp.]